MVNHCVRTRTQLLLPWRCQLPLLPPVLPPLGLPFRYVAGFTRLKSLLVGAGSGVPKHRANRFGQPPFNTGVPPPGVSPTFKVNVAILILLSSRP
jgi:hypothetical protein